MKVSFTGTRHGMTFNQDAVIHAVLVELDPKSISHGDCIGADADAHLIAEDLALEIRTFPADVSESMRAMTGKEYVVCDKAKKPLERNKDIVNDGDFLIACPGKFKEELRSGTWAAVRYARRKQKPIIIIWPDGTIELENKIDEFEKISELIK